MAGAVAVLCLAVRRDRRWWTRVLPAAVLASAVVVAGMTYLVDRVGKPWPEPLPPVLVVWAGAALVAASLAVARLRAGRWYRRAGRVLLALVVLVSAGTAANAYFGFYPTSRAALEVFANTRVGLDAAARPPSSVVEVPPGGKLADVWRSPVRSPRRQDDHPLVSGSGFERLE